MRLLDYRLSGGSDGDEFRRVGLSKSIEADIGQGDPDIEPCSASRYGIDLDPSFDQPDTLLHAGQSEAPLAGRLCKVKATTSIDDQQAYLSID